MADEIEAYAVGICAASACAPATASPDEVADAVNASHPTGISSRWSVSGDPTFASGEPNPCPCNRDPDSRRHWLLTC